jgi:tetratricopeptide (TPR) repeat protein
MDVRGRWVRLSPVRKAVSATLGVLGAVMLLVGAWDRFRPVSPSYEQMSGDVNVAVAEFGGLERGGAVEVTDTSSALAQSVYEVLDRELADLEASSGDGLRAFDYETQPPEATGSIDGSTPGERAVDATAIAERTAADIVIYATVEENDNGTAMTTEFFITDPRLISGGEELAGYYQLGEPLQQAASVSSNIAARRALREGLLGRTDGLLQLIVGLSFFGQHDYRAADQVLANLEASGRIGPADGAEVLHLFRGNTLSRMGMFDAAEDQYRRSLAINSKYARSLVGLAETTYQRAHGGRGCAPGTIGAAAVRQSVMEYRAAREAGDRPPLANVDEKVALGVGRGLLCLSLADAEESWDEARAELTLVTDAYEEGNSAVAELAAEAWSNLGLLEMQTAAGDAVGLERAIRYWETAIATATPGMPDDRRYLWYGFIGFAQCQLGHASEAESAYAEAIRLGPPAADPRYEAALERLQQGDPTKC